MKKKNVSVLLVLMILLVSIPKYNFAEEKGKVIFISMINIIHTKMVRKYIKPYT